MSGSSSGLCVGVDGGGTRTVALVGRAGDVVLGRGEAGPSNPRAVGFDDAASQIGMAIRAALAGAGLPDGAVVDRMVLGIAATGLAAARERLAVGVAARLGVAEEGVRVVPDIALVLPAAGVGIGVALVAGTGSSAFGVAADGRSASAGGWGYLWGDEGSAFDVGRRALRAVARAEDGLGPPTELSGALILHLGLGGSRELIDAVYRSPAPRRTIAGLAPVVVGAAQAGDGVARRILASAGRELGRLVCAVARRLDLGSEAAVVGAGGLFGAGDLVLDPLERAIRRAGLGDLRRLADEPAIGALRLATSELSMPADVA